jgi:CheY-like chemotaxis protein
LIFPLSDKKIEAPADSEAQTAAPSQEGTVLLVDDEPLVLTYCGEMIESLGYTVLLADSGEKALSIFREKYRRIDVVILDMIMPGMDGYHIFEALRQIHPSVKVVLSSGYILDIRAEKIVNEGPHTILSKPYTREELARILSAMISPASAVTTPV